MMQQVLNLSDNLHRVIGDDWAVEKRCVPSKELLEKVVSTLQGVGKKMIINNLVFDDYKLIFQLMIKMHNYELNKLLPTDDELVLMIKTFEYVVSKNNRGQSLFDADDLRVLCLLYNIISCQNNKNAYMSRFRLWGI